MVHLEVNDNLLLRSYTREDAAALFKAVEQNRAHLRPWLSWIDGTTRQEHSLAYIEMVNTAMERQEAVDAGIFLNGEIIGSVGMFHWNHQLRKGNIGYWIAKEYEGKGMLSACVNTFINFLFSQLDLNKIEIHFMPSNKRSCAIAEKFGAKIEGVLRDGYLINGKFEDLVIAGILKREWMTNNP